MLDLAIKGREKESRQQLLNDQHRSPHVIIRLIPNQITSQTSPEQRLIIPPTCLRWYVSTLEGQWELFQYKDGV